MIKHTRGEDGKFTDEQLVNHLLSSACAETVDAGLRLKDLIKGQKVAVNAMRAYIAKQEPR